MARIPGQHETIYQAVIVWKRHCLLADGSIFQAGRLWTLPHIEELIRDFVNRPDTSKRSFEDKLKDQLAQSAPETKQLAGEMLWVMMLFPSNLRYETKANLVQTVWGWSSTPFVDPGHMLEALHGGIGSAGMGFNNYRPFELMLMIRFAAAFKTLDTSERERLLQTPWGFAEWFDRLEDATKRQLRHMLLHLLFPEEFERISSRSDKKRIETAFASYLVAGDLGKQDRSPTPYGVDRRLWYIRRRLESEYPGQTLDYYMPPLSARWQRDESAPAAEESLIGEPHPEPYASAAAGRSVWLIGTGVNADQWAVFADEGIIAIGWGELGDLRNYTNRDQIKAALKESYDIERDPTNNALACYQFCRDMRVGDEVFAKRGLDRVLGRGIVRGDYEYDPSRPDFRSIRRVEWVEEGNWTLPDSTQLPVKTLTDITTYRPLRELLEAQLSIAAVETERPYAVDDAASEAFLPRSDIERMLTSLDRKKNLILQGSPGVGKTFLARRLAYALIQAEAQQNVQLIQFHQSYAYEDFIQGWRPNGDGGFSLRNGIFYDFCRRAQSHPTAPYVFIIDEINRGNLSKVFGELLLLIEADKRGPRFAIPLTYAESPVDTFFVPENLYIIGLMNTADRSLAMVDYALRRRFAFATLSPMFDSPRFRAALLARGVDEATIDKIVTRVDAVNRRISADQKNLGPGFAVGHSYFCPTYQVSDPAEWYASVIRDDIEPLLDEYWFDDREQVEECLAILTS